MALVLFSVKSELLWLPVSFSFVSASPPSTSFPISFLFRLNFGLKCLIDIGFWLSLPQTVFDCPLPLVFLDFS